MAIIKCKNCGRMIRESDRRCLYCNVLNADYIETNSVSASSLGETRRWDPSAIESATPLSRGSIVDKIVDKNHVLLGLL